MNTAEKPVDVSGWVLLDGQTLDVSLPSEVPPIAAGGRLMLVFDGTGERLETSDEDRSVTIHTAPPLSGDVLGNDGGHLALYAPGMSDLDPGPGVSRLRGYVAWGRSPGGILGDAIRARLWGGASEIPKETSKPLRLSTRRMHRGGSVGLLGSQHSGTLGLFVQKHRGSAGWYVFAPSETSPGASNANQRKPLPPLHPFAFVGPRGRPTLGCIRTNASARYDFAVFSDCPSDQIMRPQIV